MFRESSPNPMGRKLGEGLTIYPCAGADFVPALVLSQREGDYRLVCISLNSKELALMAKAAATAGFDPDEIFGKYLEERRRSQIIGGAGRDFKTIRMMDNQGAGLSVGDITTTPEHVFEKLSAGRLV